MEPAAQVSRNPYPSRVPARPGRWRGRRRRADGHGDLVGPRRFAGGERWRPAVRAGALVVGRRGGSSTDLGNPRRKRRTWLRRSRRKAGVNRRSTRPSDQAISRNWTVKRSRGIVPLARPSAPGVRVARPGPPPFLSLSGSSISAASRGPVFGPHLGQRGSSSLPGVRFPRILVAAYTVTD
jgi:hypothetical protein